MKIIKQFPLIILIAIFLISCKTSTNKEYPINNLEKNIEDNPNSEKKRMEIKFSCGEDGISEYLDDGWNIIKEDSQEKICTWKSVPATKDCNMEKDKGCKITKPDKIGEEKIYLLEKKIKYMTPTSEHLVDLIFNKLKTYKNKKIFLEKESLNKFILSLFKENWIQDLFKLTAIVK